MGRRRRRQEAQEAETLRKKRMGRLAALFLVAGATLAAIWFIRPMVSGPQAEEARLIRLAAERGVFIFGTHGDAQDFALQEPFVEETFQNARERGKRVVFVDELGGLGEPRDKATGRTPSASDRLAKIERDPLGSETSYRERVLRRRRSGRCILRGDYFSPPACYQDRFGQFMKALHTCLIRNRDCLADSIEEDLSWANQVEGLRVEALQEKALKAYRRGDPDEHERIVRESLRERDRRQDIRDRNLLLQMGRILDENEDLVAVTVRGITHWGMVDRYGLKGRRPVGWAQSLQEDYGLTKIDLSRLTGKSLGAEEERRAILAHAAGRLLETHLRNSGRCRTDREASRLAGQAVDDPVMTLDLLRKLCLDLGRSGKGADDAGTCRFVADWLEERGFLRPASGVGAGAP